MTTRPNLPQKYFKTGGVIGPQKTPWPCDRTNQALAGLKEKPMKQGQIMKHQLFRMALAVNSGRPEDGTQTGTTRQGKLESRNWIVAQVVVTFALRTFARVQRAFLLPATRFSRPNSAWATRPHLGGYRTEA